MDFFQALLEGNTNPKADHRFLCREADGAPGMLLQIKNTGEGGRNALNRLKSLLFKEEVWNDTWISPGTAPREGDSLLQQTWQCPWHSHCPDPPPVSAPNPRLPTFSPRAEESRESNKMIYFIPSSGKPQFCPETVKNLWSWQEQQIQVLWEGKSQELGELDQFLWSGRGLSFWGVSPSFSNILDDLLKLLFCVHVEFHARLHRGKLEEKEQGVKCG